MRLFCRDFMLDGLVQDQGDVLGGELRERQAVAPGEGGRGRRGVLEVRDHHAHATAASGTVASIALVNAASKGIERSSYLRSADGERRRHADGRSADQVDENAFLEAAARRPPARDRRRRGRARARAPRPAPPRPGTASASFTSAFLSTVPLNRTSSRNAGSPTTPSTALTAAIASGFPPKVEPWLPGPSAAYSSFDHHRPNGEAAA